MIQDQKAELTTKKRKRVAYIVAGIMDPFTRETIRGVIKAVEESPDTDLFIVPVKYIYREEASDTDRYEYQYLTQTAYLKKESFDAFIVATDCICALTDKEHRRIFMDSLDDIPTVLIAASMDGYPGATYKSSTGIIEGLNFLIEKEGISRICMLGGPEDSFDSIERKKAWKRALSDHGLACDDSMYEPTLLISECGEQANRLLDRNPDAEAVFCVNDEVAYGLYDVLRSRGLEPGADVRVLGFDNMPGSTKIIPALSTVDADPERLGAHAGKMALRILAGEKVGKEELPTRFLLRESFGKSEGGVDYNRKMLLSDGERGHSHINSLKSLVHESLSFNYGNDQAYQTMIRNLDWLGIRNAFVYIYDKPVMHLEGEVFSVPDNIRLKAVMRNDEIIDIPYNSQLISPEKIFDNEYMEGIEKSCAMQPLYFGETLYGFMIHDMTESVFENSDFLSGFFGSVVRMIDVLRESSEILKQYEDSVAYMRMNNVELDLMSKNDALTGIFNRRGFFEAAQQMLVYYRSMGQPMLIAYVDMNNLKIINDRFGHEEGDFALKTIGRLLSEVVPDAVIGRIGGDEYSFSAGPDKNSRQLRELINKKFEQFNENSDKPYYVTVSCGFYRIKPNENISIEDAMAMADRQLYEAKKTKDKRIIKEA